MRLALLSVISATTLQACGAPRSEPVDPQVVLVGQTQDAAAQQPSFASGLRLIVDVDCGRELQTRRDDRVDRIARALAVSFQLLPVPTQALSSDVLARLDAKVGIVAQGADGFLLRAMDPADQPLIDQVIAKECSGEWRLWSQANSPGVACRVQASAASAIQQSALEQARETVARRLTASGLGGTVTLRGTQLVLEVASAQHAPEDWKQVILQGGRLEFRLVDDESDFVAAFARSVPQGQLPDTVRFESESVPAGPGRYRTSVFATARLGAGESLVSARDKLIRLLAILDLPATRRLALAKTSRFDPDTQTAVEDGWRTYVVHSHAEIAAIDLSDVSAQPEPMGASGHAWSVRLRFTEPGAKRFETLTGGNVKRRMAILMDDEVHSAPVIMSAIGGGSATITIGASASSEADARRLVMLMRTGAMSARLTLNTEERR
ncbi:MAG: hypothetical protein HY898_28560 [Deltaproteobacteria bacterium]|nr:hypothetical protein [Deltaproteobacteria bacterium]